MQEGLRKPPLGTTNVCSKIPQAGIEEACTAHNEGWCNMLHILPPKPAAFLNRCSVVSETALRALQARMSRKVPACPVPKVGSSQKLEVDAERSHITEQ